MRVFFVSVILLVTNSWSHAEDGIYTPFLNCLKEVGALRVNPHGTDFLNSPFNKDVVVVPFKIKGKNGFYIFRSNSAKFYYFPSTPHAYKDWDSQASAPTDLNTNYPLYYFKYYPEGSGLLSYFRSKIYLEFQHQPQMLLPVPLSVLMANGPERTRKDGLAYVDLGEGVDKTGTPDATGALVFELSVRLNRIHEQKFSDFRPLQDVSNGQHPSAQHFVQALRSCLKTLSTLSNDKSTVENENIGILTQAIQNTLVTLE